MTDEKLGELLGAFANYYWSVSVTFVTEKIADWHPEVTTQQMERVLKRCERDIFWHHCTVETEGLDEPELVAEHLIAVDENDFVKFIAARIDAPFCDCDENALFAATSWAPDLPETKAIMDFGRTEMGLDDEWSEQLAHDCIFHQPYSLCDKEPWVMSVLLSERYGKIHFQTVDQVRRFRELGNRLYLVFPNPVLRGWAPAEIENPPVLLDDIPERDEDIPYDRPKMEAIFAPLREKCNMTNRLTQELQNPAVIKKRKIGRNAPCPCGSGLKFKKCTCTEYHPE